jgi:hypothetical protein
MPTSPPPTNPADTVCAGPRPDERGQARPRGLSAWLSAWRERRSASRCCRDLLQLYRVVAARHPELGGDGLYRQVVAARIGGDGGASAVVRRATESYATWPVERALTFRDVVHYLAVSEFMASHSASSVYTGIRRIVDASIPPEL